MKREALYDPKAALERVKNSENRYWCPVPWMSSSTTTDGHYRLCVQASQNRETRGLLKDANGNKLKAQSTRLSEGRNGDLAKEVRLSMLAGKPHETCQRCLSEEEAGLMSRRVMNRVKYVEDHRLISFEDCKKNTDPLGNISHNEFPIYEIDLRLGNRCNLSCRSCSPSDSSSWYQEWAETQSSRFHIGGEPYHLVKKDNKNTYSSAKTLNWFGGSKLRKFLNEDSPHLKALAIVGGEPLLIDEHFRELEEFVHSGRAKQLTLEYNSNLTVLPERILKLWAEFKEVKIGISLDGVDKVNDYIRHPSRFRQIERNILRLRRAPGNYDLWITFTLMAYNALFIPELIHWTIQSGFAFEQHPANLFFVPHTLKNPRELSIGVLPETVQNHVQEKMNIYRDGDFKESCSLLEDSTRRVWLRRFDYLQEYLSHSFKQAEKVPMSEFYKATQRMDAYRQQKFEDSLPELARYISMATDLKSFDQSL